MLFATTVSPESPFEAPLRVGDAAIGKGQYWMDNVKEWTSLAHAGTASDGFPQKILEEDLC